MPDQLGDFIWYELLTSDADAAQDFYGELIGWKFADSGYPGVDYRMFSADGPPVGGLMGITAEMAEGGARPAWLGYISVDDVDASVASITQEGGSVMMPAMDMDDIGRIAMVADPQGAPFYIMKGVSDESSESFAKYEAREGHCAWNELVTADPNGAKSFYCEMFGWKKTDEMDMGEMGLYEMLGAGDYTLGAVMPKPAEMPVSLWSYYFRVPAIDAAAEYVAGNGGQIINGPMEIPGGEYIVQGIDPQGAIFSLIGKQTEA